MDQLTERAKRFRAAIAAFVGKKSEKKPKDENGNYASATPEECEAWLSSAIKHVPKLYTATHVLKATHPKANGSDLHAPLRHVLSRPDIGTHSVASIDVDIIASTAAHLGASSFLRAEALGRRVLDWVREGDQDFRSSLHPDPGIAEAWMEILRSLTHQSDKPASHPLAKQLYWLTDDDPRNDTHYHLLQPMFSSTLMHAVHADIQDARFGEVNVDARKAFREKKPWDAHYRDYRNLAFRKLGGTKPQNISQLNSERGGINYLLPSLPKPAWKSNSTRPLKRDSAFGELLWFGGMHDRVRTLADFLASDPAPTTATRKHRETIEQAIGQELSLYGATVRAQYEAGWTRDPQCELPLHQQLWLDPDRTTLDVRHDPAHPEWREDDETFNADYERGDWADAVACDFGLWLNQQLRTHSDKLLALNNPEMRHFARQAILEVAWPVPMQRRAAAGGAA